MPLLELGRLLETIRYLVSEISNRTPWPLPSDAERTGSSQSGALPTLLTCPLQAFSWRFR